MAPSRSQIPSAPVRATLLLSAFALAGTSAAHVGPTAPGPATRKAARPGSRRPLRPRRLRPALAFEANRGQTGAAVRYLARFQAGTLFLTRRGAVLRMPLRPGDPKPAELRLEPRGANPRAPLVASGALPGAASYFRGADPADWVTGAARYREAGYRGIYPGIDLVFREDRSGRGNLEYDLRLAAGADPQRIQLGLAGAERAKVDPATGDLILKVGGHKLRQHRPIAYQEIAGRRVPVACSYVLEAVSRQGAKAQEVEKGGQKRTSANHLTDVHPQEGGHFRTSVTALTPNTQHPTPPPHSHSPILPFVSFEVASYDRTRPLVIDPVISYATYLGGSNSDAALAVATGPDGSLYATGRTASIDFPFNPQALGDFHGGTNDAFVARLNPAGDQILYSVYLGGRGDDSGRGIAVDADGNAVVTGSTQSGNFPRSRALQGQFGGIEDAFVTKLNARGTQLLFSTYLGGSEADRGDGVALGTNGQVYLTGQTLSRNLAVTPGAFQRVFGGGLQDSFAASLHADGRRLAYLTYLGGTGTENRVSRGSLAVGADGSVTLAGTTDSTDFPVTRAAYQRRLRGASDAYVARLNAQGRELVFSTYCGGTDVDLCGAVAIDADGNAVFTGITASTDFPTTGRSFQPDYGGGATDAFVTRLFHDGSRLLFSSYLGGTSDEGFLNDERLPVGGVAIRRDGLIWVAGRTGSLDFPVTGAFQTDQAGDADAFLVRMPESGDQLQLSTFFGGGNTDAATGLAIDRSGNLYVSGTSASLDLPTTAAVQAELGGDTDGFLLRIHDPIPKPQPGRFSISTRSLNFGSIRLGTTRVLTVTLSNPGRGALRGNVPQTRLPFTIFEGVGDFRLGPGESKRLRVRYAPVELGSSRIRFTITSSDPKNRKVSMSARGQAT